MAVNNNNTDTQENITREEILLPESLIEKLSNNQVLIIKALAKNPEGMLSRSLSHTTGISNKSDTIKLSVHELLAKYSLEIGTKRIPEKKQWLWFLRLVSSTEKEVK